MTCREGRGSMFIAKSNEEKRSMAWRIVISTASVLIILIGAFFLFKMFTGNPLEGDMEKHRAAACADDQGKWNTSG